MSRIATFLLFALALAALPATARADSLVSLTTTPQNVSINSLYNGTTITVTGQAPAGSQVLVRVTGEPKTYHMKEKGKVFGLLWMNRDKVAFENAPSLFLVAASSGLSAAETDAHGVPGLAQRITVESTATDKAALVAEFLKYQKAQKLYRENSGEVSLGADSGDVRPFTAVMAIPSRLSPGAYSVEALAVKDGAVVAKGEAAITASFVGAPAFLADMAFGHGTLYGILASIIAILGGIIIGQIFSGSKSGAH